METLVTNQPTIKIELTGKVTDITKGPLVHEIKVTKNLPHGDLLNALYFMWEAYNRAGMDFFLVKSTAKAAMTSHMLDGDTIEMGVRKLEWVSDNKDLFMIFIGNEPVKVLSETDDLMQLEYKGVKIELHLYDDAECLRNLVPVYYEHESFWVPNQFEYFSKELDK